MKAWPRDLRSFLCLVSRLLVIHAISGCDTTSALFGHGKVSVFRKLSTCLDQRHVDILESGAATQEEVMLAGCRMLALLYTGNVTDSLNRLRYTMYHSDKLKPPKTRETATDRECCTLSPVQSSPSSCTLETVIHCDIKSIRMGLEDA